MLRNERLQRNGYQAFKGVIMERWRCSYSVHNMCLARNSVTRREKLYAGNNVEWTLLLGKASVSLLRLISYCILNKIRSKCTIGFHHVIQCYKVRWKVVVLQVFSQQYPVDSLHILSLFVCINNITPLYLLTIFCQVKKYVYSMLLTVRLV